MLTVVTLVLASAIAASGQPAITGKWLGSTRNGTPVVLELSASGSSLTGTVTRDSQPSPITEGKVSKNSLTFKATLGSQEEALTGEIDGDQLKVWLDRQGRETAIVFKRARD